MTVYIVDTNIVLSAALNPDGNIAQFVLSAADYKIQLAAPSFMKRELAKHADKVVERTGLLLEEVEQLIDHLYGHFTIVDDADIPIVDYMKAAKFVNQVDADDITFIALGIHKNCYLLTGDLALYRGVLAKGYAKVITFQELKEKHNIA